MSRPASVFSRTSVPALLIALGLLPVAHAQEVEQKWETPAAWGQTLGSERQAQVAIEGMFSSLEQDGPFPWKVVKAKVGRNKVSYDYRITPMKLIKTDWEYKFGNTSFATEDEMKAAILASLAVEPGCPANEVTAGEWAGIPAGGEGSGADGSNTGERADYGVRFYARFSSEVPCTLIQSTRDVSRTRTVNCPNPGLMKWRPELESCGIDPMMESGFQQMMSYSSTPVSNQCSIGNPCDPTTGDKHQPELDLDLGWIQLTRHYHSLMSTPNGGFGDKWTHSHNIQLAIGSDSAAFPPSSELLVGLVEADGSQVAFHQTGNGYEAVSGSGDRLSQQGPQWVLQRRTETLRFDAEGRMISRTRDDGTALAYDYDGMGRLLSIAHSSGRILRFHYNAPQRADLVSALSVAEHVVATYAYGAVNQVASVTYADGATRSYHYEDSRFPQYLTGVTAEDSRRYGWYAYDAKARVTCSRHSGDCSQVDVGIDGTRLAYTAAGTAVVTDALGHVSTYGLTGNADGGYPRKVTGVTDTQGASSRTYYSLTQDFRRRVDTITDRRGTQTKYTYGAGIDSVTGQPVEVQTTIEAVGLPQQRDIETHTDAASNRVVLSRVGNRETRITRNSRLQPITVGVKDTAGNSLRTTELIYCEAADVAAGGNCPQLGLLKQVDGPRTDVNDIVTYSYYPADDTGCAAGGSGSCNFRKGDLQSVTNALGHTVTTLAYDHLGRPLSMSDSNNVVTDYSYHPRGWPTAVTVRGDTAASDRTTWISYWPTGQVQEVTEPDGSSVTYVYDAAQRLTDIADSAGNTIHYTLDDAGNRLSENTVDASGSLRRTLARIYNTLGELTALEDAGGHATVFSYDEEGNPATLTDALQRVTRQQYDPLNRLARTLQDVGGIEAEIKSTYNALDQVTQVTDPKGLHTTYAYNGFGDLTGQVSPDSGITSFTVDAAGNRKTRTDARGITAAYHYDALNRLTGRGYPDPNLDVGYTYDAAPAECAAEERFAKGRLGKVLHAGGSTLYCHDRLGQVTRKVQIINGVSTTVRYAYTKGGRLARLTYPDGIIADYVRDSLGRISEIGVTRPGQARQVVVTNVTYAPFGPATGWTYGNGRQLQRPVDTDYRPQAIHDAAAGGLSLSYGYDPVGSITELKSGNGATVLARYGYDALGRLTQTQDGPTSTPIETYVYDATGNRVSLTTASGTATYAYPADSHRLLAVDGEPRTYDAAGNTLNFGGKDYVYSDANRMDHVKQGNVVLESYTYNHRGERVLRTSTAGDAKVTLYDEVGQWLGNYSASGSPVQQAIWLGNYPVALISAPAVGMPELTYIQPDHLSTPRVAIDPARDVAIWEWSNKGEVFGNQVPNSDPDGDGIAFELAMRFPGQQVTSASGLFYNYQRDYDSSVGRYVQSDPIGLRGGISSYGYVSGSPTIAIDARGLQRSSLPRPIPVPGGGGIGFDADGYPSADTGYTGHGSSIPMVGGFPADSYQGVLSSAAVATLGAVNGYFAKRHGAKPSREQRPDNCPVGTRPIDKWPGLSKDDIHDIKDGVNAGPKDWVGISPDGNVWINEGGTGSDQGPFEGYLP